MSVAQTDLPTPRKPLRLWPGVVLVMLQFLTLFVLSKAMPDQGLYWFFGTLIGGLGIVVWWVFFSRAPWSERLGAIALMIAALFATSRVIHVSVANVGQGMLFGFYAAPLLAFVFAVAVVASSRLGDGARRAVMVAVILLASAGWALVRIGGISMTGGLDVAWRWSPTPEERLLAQTKDDPAMVPPTPATPSAEPAKESTAAPAREPAREPIVGVADKPAEKLGEPQPAAPAAKAMAEWPGFRGPHRDSIVRGLRIETNWSASPPVELWRRAIGPGWSSFAVSGDLLYTQEQRGEEEIVACYNLKTGQPVWMHRDATRFWEANAGPGPRGTPTLSNGRVYTFGATGILNALEAANGAVLWSRNLAADADVKVPYWGFASSPLVVDDLVIVAAAGRLAAYDLATGKPRWLGPARSGSYGSPHLVTIDGVAQVLHLNGAGAISVAPANGAVLWEHKWEAGGAAMLQPALTADGDILITAGGMSGGEGMRRIAVTHEPGAWSVQERWTSRGLKPYFNDFVVHRGHAYGFDGSILACIDLNDGQRKWKGGRYGNGQMVLLPDEDLLLVLSEDGELALVRAAPDQFTELARSPAIEGKTW
ncbi:MAG: PQQ-like beta-propeller repeat protein, partial [Gemmataceae bacterium]|nr:PQQ-like beta-propeller repeat protein [Gemmataceae bacterium]